MVLIVLLVLALTSITPVSRAETSPSPTNPMQSLNDRFVREFEGSYARNSNPNGVIKKFELHARPFDSGVRIPYRARLWGYNEQVPGAILRIRLGDTLEVKLFNELDQPTTIHWHGVRVANAMDGVPDLTQKAVKAGESFTYRFTPKDAGTFWFHSHFNSPEQVEKGLYGVLIVEDPNEPPYSRELVWVLDDWLLEADGTIHDQFVTRHDLAHDGRWGNFLTVNGQYQPTFSVKPGERIRVRIINVANGRVFLPTIDGIDAFVIAVDGMPVAKAFPFQDFYIAPGNRVDLDLTIPAKTTGRELQLMDRLFGRQNVLANLSIDAGKPVQTPLFDPPQARHFPEWKQAESTPLDHEYILDAERGGPYGIAWTIDAQTGPHSTFEAQSGRFYHLRFTNRSARLHPMHLHGQFFRVIAKDGQAANEPFWRDTVLVGPEQSVDIALVPLDPGAWMNHCHILEHAEAGMMAAFHVK